MTMRRLAVVSIGGLLLIGPVGERAWAEPPWARLLFRDPRRLLDTRVPAQGPALASGASRLVAVPGSCGIPADARAITANIAAVASTGAGNIRLYAGDGTVPQTAAVNFGAGQTRANNGVFALANNGNGTLAIFAAVAGGGTVHAVLDVTGYFDFGDVFVSPVGNDGSPGTCGQPLLTIQAAIDLAASLGRDVAVVAGTYNAASTIALANGVSLRGGFAVNCSRPESGVTEIVVAQPRAISASGIFSPTTLDLLTIKSAANFMSGGSAYGVFAVNSPGLTIQRSTIVAGSGGAGPSVSNGQVGANGNSGGQGQPGCEEEQHHRVRKVQPTFRRSRRHVGCGPDGRRGGATWVGRQ